MFNFTFSFSVPGVPNPFSYAPAEEPDRDRKTPAVAPSAPLRRPHPATLPPALPLSRKRGWVPSEPEVSQAATIPASSSGYLDTPAKYRDFTITPNVRVEDEVEEMVADLPPAKRRRTLAGSIVSTAVSAALIGTAVGLTVYRLWRDRGKDGGQDGVPTEPPPPYARGDWPHGDEQHHHSARHEANNLPAVNVVPPTPNAGKRARRTAPVAGKRTPIRQRRPRPTLQPTVAARPAFAREPSPTPSLARSPVRPEFNFSSIPADLPDEAEDQDPDESMDWMGDRLAQLIAEGQRALGKEVVVTSEAPEDEEDDMSGAWDDEPEPSLSAASSPRRSQSNRSRRRRPAALGIPSAFTASTSALPSPPMSATSSTSAYASSMSMSVPMMGHERARSEGAGLGFSEDSSSWQSAEMRESMERARARLLASRAR
ncbi:unnamed protein product [Peniophora sp. CBMAI 1063]|nr:unnamed protein product [Peniophora sp. CBMAI 1063]